MDTDDRYAERAPWTPFDLWASMHAESLRRVEATTREIGKRNATAFEQADVAITEMARLGTSSMGVVRQLSDEWFRAARVATHWFELWLHPLPGFDSRTSRPRV
jgi:hypothetical protein